MIYTSEDPHTIRVRIMYCENLVINHPRNHVVFMGGMKKPPPSGMFMALGFPNYIDTHMEVS